MSEQENTGASGATAPGRGSTAINPRKLVRRLIFTCNNPTEDDLNRVKVPPRPVRFLIVGDEVGKQGTRHLQGFIHLEAQHVFSVVQKWMPRAHFDHAFGDDFVNDTYCSKQKEFVRIGAPYDSNAERRRGGLAGAAKRKADYDSYIEHAKHGRFDEIPGRDAVAYYRTWRQIYIDNMPSQPDLDTEHTAMWLVGAPGTGKTSFVRDHWEPSKCYYKASNSKWFDRFDPHIHQYVVLEDIDPDSCKFVGRYLKIWTDRYAFQAEFKGGTFACMLRPKMIIITSNYTIEQCFENAQDVEAMKRRCKVIHFERPYKSPYTRMQPNDHLPQDWRMHQAESELQTQSVTLSPVSSGHEIIEHGEDDEEAWEESEIEL